MEAVGAASAIVGLAVPVFQCAKALRDRLKLVASEKVELLEALTEYEKDIDLLESLYNGNKELLVQHNLDTDLKELAEIIRELDDWLTSINPNLGKRKLPGFKELWKSGDLREKLVASNAKINGIQRRWQMRLQLCTLASTTTAVGQLGRLDSAQTETTALLQQIITILQHVLSMHTQIEPAGLSSQTTEVANTTTSIVVLAEPKSKKGGSGKSKTRVDKSRISAPAYMGYDTEKGIASSGVDSFWLTLRRQLRDMGVDESVIQDNEQFIRDFVRDYQSESTSASSTTKGTKAAAAKKGPPPPPAPRSNGSRLPPPPSRKAGPLPASPRSSSPRGEEVRLPPVSVVSPTPPPPPPPVESPPPAPPPAAPPPGPSPATSGKRKARINKSRISAPAYMGDDSEKGFTSSGIDSSWLTVVTQLRDMGVDESILQDKDNQKFMKDFVRNYQSESTSTSR